MGGDRGVTRSLRSTLPAILSRIRKHIGTTRDDRRTESADTVALFGSIGHGGWVICEDHRFGRMTPLGDRIMKLSSLPLVLAVLALTALLLAGPGTRFEVWDFRFGFTLMRYAAYTGIAAGILAVIGLLWPKLRRQGASRWVLGLVLATLVVGLPLLQVRQARAVPAIHDISTDLIDPPAFVAIAALRGDTSNPLDRADPQLPDLQRQAYPDLQPVILPEPPAAAQQRAMHAAETLGWQIVANDPASGLIEATDTTLWFGFKDDIVIRIRPEGDGSRIDLRSVSRVGRSDLGANARRIRVFLEQVQENH